MPQVRSELPAKFPKAKQMYKTPPLAINADAKVGDMTGYKAGVCHCITCCQLACRLPPSYSAVCQAVWSLTDCEASMQTNGLYEASGLALWLATEAFAKGSEDVCWQDLLSFEDAFFSKKVVFRTVVTREKQKKQRTRDRLTWPCEMIVVTETTKAVLHEEFNSSLHLASGVFVLWSWYLAVFKALVAQDRAQTLLSHCYAVM